MSASSELFLQQLARCVKHQPDTIAPGPTITDTSDTYVAGEFIPLVDEGAGYVECDTSSVWGLRPPGEEMPPATTWTRDWA